jgi:hypothetical protein
MVCSLEKLVQKNGQSWCMDVLDVFVTSGQSIARGGTLFPVGRVAIVVLVYGRPGCLRHQRTVHC